MSYLDMDNLKPEGLFCKNTGAKLEEGTLSSNHVEDEVKSLWLCYLLNA